MKQQNNTYLTNDQIEFELVTLIDETGTSHGIIKTSEAQAIADERNLDLVLVSPNQKMPVCKLMDYDKFRFDQNKKAKEQKKNQKNITTKEIQLNMGIDKHDLDTKVKNAHKFLTSGNRVYVNMRLRGRENAMSERGVAILNNFFEMCSDVGTLAKPVALQGNTISMTILPL